MNKCVKSLVKRSLSRKGFEREISFECVMDNEVDDNEQDHGWNEEARVEIRKMKLKKGERKLYTASPHLWQTVDRFSKFFRLRTQRWICNKAVIKRSLRSPDGALCTKTPNTVSHVVSQCVLNVLVFFYKKNLWLLPLFGMCVWHVFIKLLTYLLTYLQSAVWGVKRHLIHWDWNMTA